MGEMRPSKGHLAVIVAFVVGFLLLLRDTAMPPRPLRLPAPRGAHAARRSVLDLTAARVGEIREDGGERRVALMKDVAALLSLEFLDHARREEEILYGVAGRRGKAGEVAALRVEMDILRRWMTELAALAESSQPDPGAFMQRAERLLGLLEAHFEVEERLLYGFSNSP